MSATNTVSTTSWKNTFKDPEYERKYEELVNKSKDTSYKEVTVNKELPRADTIPGNRFAALLFSSSTSEDSLHELVEEDIPAIEEQETKIERKSAIDAYRKYKHARFTAFDEKFYGRDKNRNCNTNTEFSKNGDTIYRGYWRYAILKDGSIQCVNATSNRKRITQLVISRKNSPFMSINNRIVENYYAMFRASERLQFISLAGLNFEGVISVGRIFSDCVALKSVDMSNLNMNSVCDYQHMFDNCHSLKSVDFSGTTMRNAVRMDSMFYGCESIVMITITGLYGDSIKLMNHMFRDCKSLRILELPNLHLSKDVEMKKMFYGASSAIDILCHDQKLLAKFLKDKYEESSSSVEPLNELSSEGDESPIPASMQEFPRVLTDEDLQNAKTFPEPRSYEPVMPTFAPM